MIQDANLPLGLEDLLKVAPVDFHGPNPEHQKFVEQAAEAILMLADQNRPEPAEVEDSGEKEAETANIEAENNSENSEEVETVDEKKNR